MTKRTTTTKPTVFDLFGADNQPIRKFPATTPLGTLTIFRFTAPNAKNPEGQLVVKGYPPIRPSLVGMIIAPRAS